MPACACASLCLLSSHGTAWQPVDTITRVNRGHIQASSIPMCLACALVLALLAIGGVVDAAHDGHGSGTSARRLAQQFSGRNPGGGNPFKDNGRPNDKRPAG